MIRLGFLIDSLQTGGTELNAVRLAESLDRSRFALTVAHLHQDGPLLERYHALGIPTAHIPLGRLYGPSMVPCGLQLMRWLRQHSVQVFHAHDIYSNVFGIPWARAAGVRRLIASRRWWRSDHHRTLLRLNALASRWAGQVLSNSQTIANEVAAETGLPPSRVRYIPNFIEDAAFDEPPPGQIAEWRRSLGVSPDTVLLGIVARLVAVKDHPTLLRAMSIAREQGARVGLVIAGDGPLGPELRALASSLGISDQVRFVGEVPNRPNPHRFFDVSVLSSRSEGLPNSLLEAMAAGRPIIATSVGGVADVVVSERTGLLVPPHDPEAMAAAIIRLAGNRLLGDALGHAGRQRAATVFGRRKVVGDLESWYEDLAATQHST